MRNIAINIGKNVYSINTPLDNDDIDRVKTIIDDACGDVSKSSKQEDILMLACLRLAYSLDNVNQKIIHILDALEH